MFHAIREIATSALVDRVTLLINHVLAAESSATQRLRSHVGRCIAIRATAWPDFLPAPPQPMWRVTPAGLFEQDGAIRSDEVSLRIDIDAANPARLALQALAGERPRIDVTGDAALASDMNWLIDNLRWDFEDDLEALIGPAAAQQLGAIGRALAHALRRGAGRLAGVGRGAEPPP
jgi:ubiquinone biosynthesis accessory factor UbiJ